jgi:hypothetical protein
MRELVSGWMETGQGADREALRRLAGMLSECLDSCVSALSKKVSAPEDVAHRTTACVAPTSTRASDASRSFVPHNVNGFCFGTLNVTGKLGSNVQQVMNLLSNVKLDILCIQESLHATIEVPDYLWVTLKRSSNLISAASHSSLRGVGFLVKKELRNLMTTCTEPIEHDPDCSRENFGFGLLVLEVSLIHTFACLCTWTPTRQQKLPKFLCFID